MYSLAVMPVLGKQVEENPLLWVLSNDILIQFHPKPWPLRECEVAIYYLGIPRCWSEGNTFAIRFILSYNYMVL
jgi:hypothetical protein